jgi:hypothetical protein
MRGHTESIVELSFFQNAEDAGVDLSDGGGENVDLLASTGKDGNIFLWKIDSPTAETVVYPTFSFCAHATLSLSRIHEVC